MTNFCRAVWPTFFLTSMSMLLACGSEQDVLTRIDNSAASAEAVEIDIQVGHEALKATVHISPTQSLDLTIVNSEDEQVIRVTDGLELLFQQRLNYDGRIREISTLDASFSIRADNSIAVPTGSSFDQYFRDCYERRILCFRDAAKALSLIESLQPAVFSHFNGENALTGLEAIKRASETIVGPSFPELPIAQDSISNLPVDLAVK